MKSNTIQQQKLSHEGLINKELISLFSNGRLKSLAY